IGKRPDVNNEALHIDALDVSRRLLLRPESGASDCGGDSGCREKRAAACPVPYWEQWHAATLSRHQASDRARRPSKTGSKVRVLPGAPSASARDRRRATARWRVSVLAAPSTRDSRRRVQQTAPSRFHRSIRDTDITRARDALASWQSRARRGQCL